MRSQLEANGVQIGSVSLQSSVSSAGNPSLVFQATLSTPSDRQASALADFNGYFSSTFMTIGGEQVQDVNRELIGVTSACKLRVLEKSHDMRQCMLT